MTADWLKPDQSSGLTVETTAYVLLAVLLKVLLSPGTTTVPVGSGPDPGFVFPLEGEDPLRQPHPHLAVSGPALRRRFLLHEGTDRSGPLGRLQLMKPPVLVSEDLHILN